MLKSFILRMKAIYWLGKAKKYDDSLNLIAMTNKFLVFSDGDTLLSVDIIRKWDFKKGKKNKMQSVKLADVEQFLDKKDALIFLI